MYAEGDTPVAEIAKVLGVSRATIYRHLDDYADGRASTCGAAQTVTRVGPFGSPDLIRCDQVTVLMTLAESPQRCSSEFPTCGLV